MRFRRWAASFRTRILLVVLGVTVLPLGLVGLWLTGAAARSGEELITERVESAVRDAAVLAGSRWVTHRSGLLDVTDEETFWRALATAASEPDAPSGVEPPPAVISILRASPVPMGRVTVRDSLGRLIWEYDAGDPSTRVVGPTLEVGVDVYASSLGPRLGTLHSELAVATLVPDKTPAPGGVGTMLGVYEPDGAPLAPLPFVLESETAREISWARDRWILARRELVEPALVVVAAAPLSPFTAPYLGAAQRGAFVLAVVGVLGLLLTLVLTNRMATSLERLAEAADAVSDGDLERSVDVRGDDEMSRVGRAFNHMTDNLKMSLQELSDSRALAAVGEFAAELAHEIRNPLSAVRIDLQMVEEGLPEGSRLREIQERVLSELERLDVTLGGALRTAQSGHAARGVVDVREPLIAAVTSARTTAGPRGPDIVIRESAEPTSVTGNAAALEQIFLNLLLNAIQASDEGECVEASLSSTDVHVVIAVADRGVGIASEDLPRVYDPLYTTRRDGSGLGLTIARRLVIAHSGHIEIESKVGAGTVVRVLLPAVIDHDEGLRREAPTASPNVAASGSTLRYAT
ncbi:MAG: HAMP domain-containing sensor histidine kinase [Dehalococcoidia bacterium]